MEKYGVERKDLPVTEAQTKQIQSLMEKTAADITCVFIYPSNAQEADELIERMSKQNG